MATKSKENNDKPTAETWRKPLQVPPRTNAMRSFYRGAEDETAAAGVTKSEEQESQNADSSERAKRSGDSETKTASKPTKKRGREAVKTKPQDSPPVQKSDEPIGDMVMNVPPTKGRTESSSANQLTEETLAEKLGIKTEELFDVHELLRGKSFDIYRMLQNSLDENGRCKITQPELMRRTGIKNRRTFYKHEEWLINLKLIEKRHLPGDHKGVVYRVLKMSDVLPLPAATLEKFKQALENPD